MTTLEKKVSLLMEYAVEENRKNKAGLKRQIMELLCEPEEHEETSCCDVHSIDGVDDMIDELMREIGVPCHPSGYDQAIYAIKLAAMDERYIRYMTDRLYPAVAAKFDVGRGCPERNIRHVVSLTFNGVYGSEDAYALFKNTVSKRTGKPTNQQFIAVCSKEIRRRLRDRG